MRDVKELHGIHTEALNDGYLVGRWKSTFLLGWSLLRGSHFLSTKYDLVSIRFVYTNQKKEVATKKQPQATQSKLPS